jgi:amino acid transporter
MAENEIAENDVLGPFGAPIPESEESAQLRADELNLFDATAVAVSSVAPAYSLAATVAAVFMLSGVGLQSPSIILLSFVPVLFIAIAYFHLNRKDPDCGASYSWLSKLMSPYVGWFNGWVQVATSVIFCMAAPVLAGQYTLQLLNSFGWINDSTAGSIWWASVIAAIWLILITGICVYGIRWTTNFQWVLVIIEYVVVVGFSVGGIIKVIATHPAGSQGFSFSWLNPMTVLNHGGMTSVAEALALGVFFFWGWDTAVNLNEETKDRSKTPGRAGILSMWLLLFVFLLNFIAVQMLVSPKQIEAQDVNILFYFSTQLFGNWAGYAMIFAVITSTVATTQTTLLPSARIAYSMSRDKVFPKIFGSIHPKFRTPAVGTLILALFALFGILLSTGVSSVGELLGKLVGDIGILVAFYYGMTGVTCAWAFRKVAFKSARFLVTGIILPLISGLVLLGIVGWIIKSDPVYAMPDIVILGLGVVLAIVARFTTNGDFFKTKPVAYTTID